MLLLGIHQYDKIIEYQRMRKKRQKGCGKMNKEKVVFCMCDMLTKKNHMMGLNIYNKDV